MPARVDRLTARAEWDGRDFQRGVRRSSGELDKFRGAVRLASRAMGALGLAVTARAMVRMADEWTNIANRVKLFTESAEEAARVQENLFQISQRTRSSMSASTELFQRLAQANKNLKLEQQELQDVLETLNQTLVISGTSSESAKAGLIQLGQAFASGQLRGEELRSVMEQMPRLTMALTEGLDTNVAGLRKMAEAGELTADRVIKAIQSQAKVINSEFANMEMTVDQSGTVFVNSLGRAISKMNEATSATRNLAETITSLADAIDGLSDSSSIISRIGRAAGSIGLSENTGLGNFLRLSPTYDAYQRRQSLMGFVGPRRPPYVPPIEQARLDRLDRFSGTGMMRVPTRGGLNLRRGGLQGFEDTDRLGMIDNAFRIRQEAVGDGGPGGLLRTNPAELERQRRALDLLNRSRAAEAALVKDLDARERALLNARQEAERATTLEADSLTKVHELEKAGLSLKQAERQAKENELKAERIAVEQSKEVARRERELARIYEGTANVLSRLLPQVKGFFDAMSSALQGDKVGAVVNTMHGLLDVLGIARNEEIARLRAIEEATRAIRAQTRSIHESLLGVDEGMAVELRSLQLEASQPLRDYFEQITSHATKSVSRLQLARIAMNALIETLEALERNAVDGKFALEDFSLQAQDVFRRIGMSPEELFRSLTAAFAPEQLSDIAFRIFDVRDAFKAAADAADLLGDALAPAQRAIRAQADVAEIQLRAEAMREFQRAGADPFEQARIFKRLQQSIAAISSKEAAELKALGPGGGSVDPVSGEPVPAPGTVPGSSTITTSPSPLSAFGVDEFSDIIAFEGAITKIDVPWHHAVQFVQSPLPDFDVDEFADLVAFEGDIAKIRVPWHHAVRFTQQMLSAFGVASFTDIVAFQGAIGKVKVPWHHAVRFTQQVLHQFGIASFSDIVAFQGAIGKIKAPWHHALKLTTSTLDQFGVDRWSQIVRLERVSTFAGYDIASGPAKHQRPWSDAIDLFAANLDNYSINRWSQMVRLDRSNGDAPSKHFRPVSDILEIDLSRPVEVNIKDAVRLVGSPRKLKASDIIDLSELQSMIIKTVDRNRRDRNLSESGTIT